MEVRAIVIRVDLLSPGTVEAYGRIRTASTLELVQQRPGSRGRDDVPLALVEVDRLADRVRAADAAVLSQHVHEVDERVGAQDEEVRSLCERHGAARNLLGFVVASEWGEPLPPRRPPLHL